MPFLVTPLKSKAFLFAATVCTAMTTFVAVEITASQAKIEAPTVLASVAPSLPFTAVLTIASLVFFGRKGWKQALLLWTLAAAVIALWNNAASWLFFLSACRVALSHPSLRVTDWLLYAVVGWALTSAALAFSIMFLYKAIMACRDVRPCALARIQNGESGH